MSRELLMSAWPQLLFSPAIVCPFIPLTVVIVELKYTLIFEANKEYITSSFMGMKYPLTPLGRTIQVAIM